MKNEQVKQLTILTLLLIAMTSISLKSYADESTTLNIPPLTLNIPEPLKLNPGSITPKDQVLLAFTIEQYGTLLKIATGYKLWARDVPLQLEINELWSQRIDLCHQRIEVVKDSLKIAQEDREHVYKLLNIEIDRSDKSGTWNTIKTVLYIVGGVVVGCAAGIIIGVSL